MPNLDSLLNTISTNHTDIYNRMLSIILIIRFHNKECSQSYTIKIIFISNYYGSST